MTDPPTLWVLDRMEDGAHAVLVSEEGGRRTVRLKDLPDGVREGDALREIAGTEASRYMIDEEATRALRRETEDLRSSLRRGPSGDISL